MIRNIKLSDTQSICNIYNYYIKNTVITFEEEEIYLEEMEKRISKIIQNYPWLVYEESNKILGYAYISNWHHRSAYKHTLESTIYLSEKETQKGIGSKLYSELIKAVDKKICHSLISVIALPNEKSQTLHEKFNFKKVGHLKKSVTNLINR